MNILASFRIVEELYKTGVREWVVCAGSRNSPLIEVLASFKNSSRSPLKIYSHFDERSASFFALGRAKATDQPVAIVTTSGTAVSETLSSLIESEYHGSRLVVVSADRPENWRGTGAPQTIRQNRLLEAYADTWDGDVKDVEVLAHQISSWHLSGHRNLHINIQFDEPLLDLDIPIEVLADQKISQGIFSEHPDLSVRRIQEVRVEAFHKEAMTQWLAEQKSLNSSVIPLIVLSGLSCVESETVVQALKENSPDQYLIYAEGPSRIRESHTQYKNLLFSDDAYISQLIKQQKITGVLRIGRTPTGRFWRDLETTRIPVLHCSPNGYLGLSYGQLLPFNPVQILSFFKDRIEGEGATNAIKEIRNADRSNALKFERVLNESKNSDLSFIRKLSTQCERGSFIYVGNSLPIRQWDSSAHRLWPLPVSANRGANGIDGQIASALGEGWNKKVLHVVLGDLTTLYDINSLSWLHQNFLGELRLYIVNNGGGQIFSRMYTDALYLNAHHFKFKGFAEAFGLSYERWTDSEVYPNFSSRLTLIEIVPDQQKSKMIFETMKAHYARPFLAHREAPLSSAGLAFRPTISKGTT